MANTSDSNNYIHNEPTKDDYYLYLFQHVVRSYKQHHAYDYTDDDSVTFFIPAPTRPDFTRWLFRYVVQVLLYIGICGNILRSIVMFSKGMR